MDGIQLNSFGTGENKPISLCNLLKRVETKKAETYRMIGSKDLMNDDQILLVK